MSRKRYLSMYVIIGVLLSMGAIVATQRLVAIRNGQSQMIEVCRNALSLDRPGYTHYTCEDTVFYNPLRYKRIKSSPLSVTVYFEDGLNDLWCDMQYKGSKWIVTGTATTIVGMCP